MENLPSWLNPLMQWVVVPVIGWLWVLHKVQSNQATDIAVLQAMTDAQAKQDDRIMKKLDSIETALRSRG